MNNSCYYIFTFCRKCKKLRDCLDTNLISEYRFLCKSCLDSKNMLGSCRSCGREGIEKELSKHGGYCGFCESDNITECELCGKETYNFKLENGICKKCYTGKNKPCIVCGNYMDIKKLSSDGLCEKCSIRIHRRLRESEVNEIVECIECGREVLVNDLHEGLCIYCYSSELEIQINKLKKKKSYNY